MPFIVNNQTSHQESVTYNLQKITLNPGPLLPKTVLWFQISWGHLIIMPLIMVMLQFTIQGLQLNVNLHQFQIHTPLLSNQLMIMKWTISWNFSIHNMIMIFWMLTFRFFRIDWWSPLIKFYIKYLLLCCFINTEEQMLQSQIE